MNSLILKILTINLALSMNYTFATTPTNMPSIPLPIVENDKDAPNSVRAWWYRPELRPSLKKIGKTIFYKGKFPWKLKFMVMAIVASHNKCRYCLCNAVMGLTSHKVNSSTIRMLQTDLDKVSMIPKEKVVLKIAKEITANPSESSRFVTEAKKLGWKNDEIADIIFFSTYFNLTTRIASAFNLPPDKQHPFDPNGKFPMMKCGK